MVKGKRKNRNKVKEGETCVEMELRQEKRERTEGNRGLLLSE